MALFKNPILEVSQSHKKLFWESLYVWGSQEKKLGQKVNVKYFRVDPYTLGNRIPRVFHNLSDLHVRCHREKSYIYFLSQIFLESLYIRVQRIYVLFNFHLAHTFFSVFFDSKNSLFSDIF